jgi:hypothetical protein
MAVSIPFPLGESTAAPGGKKGILKPLLKLPHQIQQRHSNGGATAGDPAAG